MWKMAKCVTSYSQTRLRYIIHLRIYVAARDVLAALH